MSNNTTTSAKPSQYRKFSLVTYLNLDALQSVLSARCNQIKGYAYCVHDKDEGKEKHTHVVLALYNGATLNQVKNWFKGCDDKGQLANTLIEPCHDLEASFRYLIHADSPEKFQYDEDSRICTDESMFTSGQKDDYTLDALNDILSGVPLREIAMRYGRDFIYHYSHFRTLVQDIIDEEARK